MTDELPEDDGADLPALVGPAEVSRRRPDALADYAPPRMPAAVEAPPSDWQRYLRSVVRHKWLVAGLTIAGTVAGFAASRLLDPRYTAKSVLWIETAGRQRERDRAPVSSEELLDPSGWIELVTSNAVLDSVVHGLRLYLAPRSPADSAALTGFAITPGVRAGTYRFTVDVSAERYRLAAEDAGMVQRDTLGDSVGVGLGFLWAPTRGDLLGRREIEFTVTAPYEAAQVLARSLRVRLDPAGSFLRVQLKGTDPALIATTLNAVAQRVAVVAADLKRHKFEELVQILGGQLAHADSVLRRAEGTLNDFRIRTVGQLQDRTGVPTARLDIRADPAVAGSLELRFTADQLRRDRLTLERLAGDRSGAARVEALATIGAVQSSPELRMAVQEAVAKRAELRALGYRYTAESAPIQRVTAELDTLERRVIPALTSQLATQLGAQETQLRPRADSAIRRLRRIPPLVLEETRLTRDVGSAEEMFTNVRQQYEGAQLALVSSLPDVRILDAAVRPQRPVSDYAGLLVLLAFAASLMVSVIGVTLWDSVDPKVRYPEHVTRNMRLGILAAIPHVSRRVDQNGGEATAPVIEALRGLRLRLLHAHAGTPLVLTVTSTSPGEGKSFVSANLALAFADAGYRSVLVDGDIRRGEQHRALGAVGVPGLTDVLAELAPMGKALQDTAYPGLRLVSAGTMMPRAPELLLSQRLQRVMKYLRTNADVIIVDSPPLAAGVDALALAAVTGELLLVLRAGTTDLQMAVSRLELAGTMPVHVLGAVLNDVHPRGDYRYYTYEAAADYALPNDPRASRWSERFTILGGRS